MVERSILATPGASGGWKVIASPFQFVTTGEERFELRVWPMDANSSVVFSGRWLQTDGSIQVFQQRWTPTVVGSGTAFPHTLGRGALLNCTVALEAAQDISTSFIQLALVRGDTLPALDVGVLLQGYISHGRSLSYPGSPLENPYTSPGRIRTEQRFAIAPGVGTYTVNNFLEGRVRFLGFYGSLQTSAVAGTRFPHLFLTSGGLRVALASPMGGVGPGAITTVSFWQDVSLLPAAGFGAVVGALPQDLVLDGAKAIETAVAGMDAADQWLGANFLFEEWLKPLPI